MSEQRLYRGKTKDGTLVKGWYVEVGRPYILPAGKSLNTDFIEVIPSSVGQITGECEFHRKEIYGGDRLRFTIFDHNDSDEQFKGTVKYADGEWQLWNCNTSDGRFGHDGPFALHWVLMQDVEAKIIGNTIDNKELLEANK